MSDYDDECTMVKTLDRERLASLWQDTAFNDVILVVEGPQTTLKIPAHKAVLASRGFLSDQYQELFLKLGG